ncbi:10100_t:CDS:2, partial [Funneliformis mosseae]
YVSLNNINEGWDDIITEKDIFEDNDNILELDSNFDNESVISMETNITNEIKLFEISEPTKSTKFTTC